MKKIFTKLYCLALVLGIFHSAIASADNTTFSNEKTSVACPTMDDVIFPDDVVISDNQLELSTLTSEVRPDSLILNYGFSHEEVFPIWDDLDNCENIAWSYQDLLLDIDGEAFKVIREWTVVDWFTTDYITKEQIILNLPEGESQEHCIGVITTSVDPWSCQITNINPEDFLAPGMNYENVSMTPDGSGSFGLGNHCFVIEATIASEEF